MSTRSKLERFVLRARFVADHTLATDRQRLRELSKPTVRMHVLHVPGEPDRHRTVPIELLPTEQVESAAARLRPLFLHADGVYYRDALDELSELASAKWYEQISACREKFKIAELAPKPSSPRPPRQGVSNAELAGAWLYGSLIHDDMKRQSYAAGIDMELAFVAASRMTCAQIVAVLETLDLIEVICDQGEQVVGPDVFTTQVSVKSGQYTMRGPMAGFQSADGEFDERTWRAIHQGDDDWNADVDRAYFGPGSSNSAH